METKYIILIAVTFGVVFFLSFVIRKLLTIFINKNSSHLGVSPTTFVFLKNSSSFVLVTIGIIWVFYNVPALKSLGASLFAGAGILVAVIGFASQKAFSNIIGGLFILIFKPFSVGDVIEISGLKKGIVESITLRHIIIKDFENRRIVIPNSNISEDTIINSNLIDQNIRKHIEVKIAFDTDLNKAITLLKDIVENHPLVIDKRTKEDLENNIPMVLIRMIAINDYSLQLKAYAWAKNNDDAYTLYCDVLTEVSQKYKQEGIEIPYPTRSIISKAEK